MEPPAQPFIVFDVGGTNIRAGIYRPDTRCVDRIVTRPSTNYVNKKRLNAEQIVEENLGIIRDIVRSYGLPASPRVIIGYPGPVDVDGNAIRSPTLLGPLDREFPIKSRLNKLLQTTKVEVINDLTAAGYNFVAKGSRDFCVVTVGSGIGNKVFLGGKPVVGRSGYGGEIGHLLFDIGDEDDRLGLGEYASGRGLNQAVSNGNVVEALERCDPLAEKILESRTTKLGQVLAVLHLAIGLEQFYITGGVVKALGEVYRTMLLDAIRSASWDIGQDWQNMVCIGAENEHEGLAGAGYFGTLISLKHRHLD